MDRPLFLPLTAAVLLTGCSVRAELDYDRSSKNAAIESALDAPDDQQRHVHREQDRTAFRLAVEGSTFDEPHARSDTSTTESAATVVPSAHEFSVDASRQTITVGTINVHVGDIHHQTHTHLHVEQNVTVVNPTVPPSEGGVTASTPERHRSTLDERCEQLRQEHEAQVAEWMRLFEPNKQREPSRTDEHHERLRRQHEATVAQWDKFKPSQPAQRRRGK